MGGKGGVGGDGGGAGEGASHPAVVEHEGQGERARRADELHDKSSDHRSKEVRLVSELHQQRRADLGGQRGIEDKREQVVGVLRKQLEEVGLLLILALKAAVQKDYRQNGATTHGDAAPRTRTRAGGKRRFLRRLAGEEVSCLLASVADHEEGHKGAPREPHATGSED